MVTSPHLSGHPGSDRAGSDGVADDGATFTGKMMSIRRTNASCMANEVCWPLATAVFQILVLRSRWYDVVLHPAVCTGLEC